MKTIDLTQGKVAIVDDDDFEELSKYKWYANKIKGVHYAMRNSPTDTRKYIKLLMHRSIMEARKEQQVDHINGNRLDNRKVNLRLCNNAENSWNRQRGRGLSKYKGIYFHKPTQKWLARIMRNGHHYHIGLYKTEEEAARAYDRKARVLFGDFAYLNFTEE